jgi:hypothetical protein
MDDLHSSTCFDRLARGDIGALPEAMQLTTAARSYDVVDACLLSNLAIGKLIRAAAGEVVATVLDQAMGLGPLDEHTYERVVSTCQRAHRVCLPFSSMTGQRLLELVVGARKATGTITTASGDATAATRASQTYSWTLVVAVGLLLAVGDDPNASSSEESVSPLHTVALCSDACSTLIYGYLLRKQTVSYLKEMAQEPELDVVDSLVEVTNQEPERWMNMDGLEARMKRVTQMRTVVVETQERLATLEMECSSRLVALGGLMDDHPDFQRTRALCLETDESGSDSDGSDAPGRKRVSLWEDSTVTNRSSDADSAGSVTAPPQELQESDLLDVARGTAAPAAGAGDMALPGREQVEDDEDDDELGSLPSSYPTGDLFKTSDESDAAFSGWSSGQTTGLEESSDEKANSGNESSGLPGTRKRAIPKAIPTPPQGRQNVGKGCSDAMVASLRFWRPTRRLKAPIHESTNVATKAPDGGADTEVDQEMSLAPGESSTSGPTVKQTQLSDDKDKDNGAEESATSAESPEAQETTDVPDDRTRDVDINTNAPHEEESEQHVVKDSTSTAAPPDSEPQLVKSPTTEKAAELPAQTKSSEDETPHKSVGAWRRRWATTASSLKCRTRTSEADDTTEGQTGEITDEKTQVQTTPSSSPPPDRDEDTTAAKKGSETDLHAKAPTKGSSTNTDSPVVA